MRSFGLIALSLLIGCTGKVLGVDQDSGPGAGSGGKTSTPNGGGGGATTTGGGGSTVGPGGSNGQGGAPGTSVGGASGTAGSTGSGSGGATGQGGAVGGGGAVACATDLSTRVRVTEIDRRRDVWLQRGRQQRRQPGADAAGDLRDPRRWLTPRVPGQDRQHGATS